MAAVQETTPGRQLTTRPIAREAIASASNVRIARWSGIYPYAVVAGILVLLSAVAVWLGNLTAFYSVDGDVKYLAALNIARHFTDPSITYPSTWFDPTGRYTLPLTAWYGGRDYAGYSLPFLYVAGFFLRVFGKAGVIFPSVLGAGVLLVAQLQLANIIGLKGRRTLLLMATVAATPVMFYSVSFWEHTLGVGLVVAGIAALLWAATSDTPGIWVTPLAGFLFLGAALMRRDTVVPALVALVVVPLAFRSKRAVALSVVAGACMLAPLAAIYILHPQPLAEGLTHASPGRAGIGVTRGLTVIDKLRFLTSGGWAMGILAAFVAVAVITWIKWRSRLPAVLVAGTFVSGLALIVATLNQYSYADDNFLAFCPLAILGIFSLLTVPPRDLADRLRSPGRNPQTASQAAMWLIVAGGAVGITVMASDDGGAQWGPRYLLFVFPILTLLALKAHQDLLSTGSPPRPQRALNYGFVAILAMSFLLQVLGLFALHVKQTLAATVDQKVGLAQVRVVVSQYPVIDILAPSYETHTYLYAPTTAELSQVMHRLRVDGTRRLVMLCDSTDPCHWNGYAGWHRGKIATVKHIAKFAIYRRLAHPVALAQTGHQLRTSR